MNQVIRHHFFEIYKRLPVIRLENLLEPKKKNYSEEYHDAVLQNMHHAFIETTKYKRKSMKARNIQYNKKLQPHTFKVGDHVLLKNFKPTSKLSLKWQPYFVITEKHGENSFVLKNLLTGIETRAHADNMRQAKLLWKVGNADPNVRKSRLVASPPESDYDSDTTDTHVPQRTIPRLVRSKMLERNTSNSDEPLNEFQIRKILRNKDDSQNENKENTDPYNMEDTTLSYDASEDSEATDMELDKESYSIYNRVLATRDGQQKNSHHSNTHEHR